MCGSNHFHVVQQKLEQEFILLGLWCLSIGSDTVTSSQFGLDKTHFSDLCFIAIILIHLSPTNSDITWLKSPGTQSRQHNKLQNNYIFYQQKLQEYYFLAIQIYESINSSNTVNAFN